MNEDSVELPKYKCFKEVRAAKITGIEPRDEKDGGTNLLFGEISGRMEVDDDWRNQNPACNVGGYFVVYKDGYTSYSPAEAFESGYTKI